MPKPERFLKFAYYSVMIFRAQRIGVQFLFLVTGLLIPV